MKARAISVVLTIPDSQLMPARLTEFCSFVEDVAFKRSIETTAYNSYRSILIDSLLFMSTSLLGFSSRADRKMRLAAS